MHGSHETGSPYAPHTDDGRTAMLEAVGVETAADLFDIPAAVAFDDEFGIDARTERETRRLVRSVLERNDELTELLGGDTTATTSPRWSTTSRIARSF